MVAPGFLSHEELVEAADSIRCAVMRKVKNGHDLAESVPCRKDILRHWFEGKDKRRGAWVLKKEDFPVRFFPAGWDRVYDAHGQGRMVMYPITIRATLHQSVESYARSPSSGDLMQSQAAVYPHAVINFGIEQAPRA